MARGTHFDDLAREAAQSIDAARAAGQQLDLLPDEPVVDAAAPDAGRAPRGKGKATSVMRDYLAARGWRLPEQVLGEMAGLSSREDVFLYAMQRAEQVLAWAEEGAVGAKGAPKAPTTGQRLDVFRTIYATAVRAAEALLPYGLAKVTPEDAPPAAVQVFVAPGAQASAQPAQGADQARDVTPRPARLAPPPLPHEIKQNQQLAEPTSAGADSEARTE